VGSRDQRETMDDLDVLLAALPPEIVDAIHALPDRETLIEVVLDLGRRPEARYPSSEVTLLEREVVEADIAYVVDHIGSFGDDNRAGIERTLHRISAIRNRNGKVVGLTCRIGRAVYGTIEIIADFIETGKSILIMGRPGIGKTTMLREAARVLADDLGKRVVVVDTSNEIAGDGDIPHPAIGKARRMQVRTPSLQHEVMIEAVENHNPEVIVIDDLGYVQQSREEMEVLFTLLAERYERGSVMITSNLPFSKWEAIFKDPMTTAAAIDRLVHHCVILELNIPSYRMEQAKRSQA